MTPAQDNKTNTSCLAGAVADPGEDHVEDRAINKTAFQQVSLFEAPLAKLPPIGYAFSYRFTSDGHLHRHYVQHWEVQAA